MGDTEAELKNPEFQDSDSLDPINRLAFTHCTVCSGSTKRRSPSSSSLPDPTSTTTAGAGATTSSEPKPKKIMVEGDHLVRGFTKISLPVTYPIPSGPSITPTNNWLTSSFPVFRRCSSDPFSSPESVPGLGSSLYPQSPENTAKINVNDNTSKIGVNATTPSPVRGNSSALPPLPPTLRRSVSDLIPSAYQTPTKSLSRSSSGEMVIGFQVPVDPIVEESPNSKRLKRMNERMKEMSQWWDEVMREGEYGGSEDNNSNTKKEDASGTETDEEVSVEMVGECLSVHFKCPCGKGYQILLSGSNCFYKLM